MDEIEIGFEENENRDKKEKSKNNFVFGEENENDNDEENNTDEENEDVNKLIFSDGINMDNLYKKEDMKPSKIVENETNTQEEIDWEKVNSETKEKEEELQVQVEEAIDWDKVNSETKKKEDEESTKFGDLPIISNEEAISLLMKEVSSSSEEQSDIVDEPPKENIFLVFLNQLFSCFTSADSLSSSEQKEKSDLLKIMKMELDHTKPLHNQILFSSYRLLKNHSQNPGLVGSHWMDIGFQRNDPTTDLRGSGIFGVVQMLYFIENFDQWAKRIYQSSKMPTNPFPFACVSLNWTGATLHILNSGKLNTLVKSKGSVLNALNELYAAMFITFQKRWEKEGLTIKDYGNLKKQMQEKAKNPKKFIKSIAKEMIIIE